MKKLLVVAIAVLGLASFAFAQNQGMGMGMGMGAGMAQQDNQGYNCPMGNDCGMGMGGCGMMGGMKGKGYGKHGQRGQMCGNMDNQVAPTVTTKEQAQTAVQTLITNSYKGYKVTKTEEFSTPRGYTAFKVSVKDAGGNEFLFHVNPYGNVRGPWLATAPAAK